MRRTLAVAVMVAGVFALADAALTLAWQEPLSALSARRAQPRLRAELRALELALPGPSSVQRRAAVDASARALRARTRDGAAVARLRIPRIGLDAVVVRGTRPDDLKRAPGLLDSAALPGEAGTAAIAGHRTTYGAPFRHIDALRRGDRLTVATPYGTFRYAVEGTRIVDPGDLSVLRTVGHRRLILTACHPLFSAARRIVVYASQIGVGRTARALKRGDRGAR
jgi:sortase A